MASKTSATETKRLRVKKNGGKRRKAALRNKGTTPKPSVLFKD